MITNDAAPPAPSLPPEHTFLTTRDVFARYRWGRARGYQIMATEDFPPGIGGVFRLDTLLDWEARELKQQTAVKTGSTIGEAADAADRVAHAHLTLPGRSRPRRGKAAS